MGAIKVKGIESVRFAIGESIAQCAAPLSRLWVSSHGRVFAPPSSRTRPVRMTMVRELAPVIKGTGYREMCVMSDSGAMISKRVHELVLETFDGARPSGVYEDTARQYPRYHARHLNGNPLDNRIENLQWGTVKENADDARRHGTQAEGARKRREAWGLKN